MSIKNIKLSQQHADMLEQMIRGCGISESHLDYKENTAAIHELVDAGMAAQVAHIDWYAYWATGYGRAALCDFYKAADMTGVARAQNLAKVGRGLTEAIIIGETAGMSEKQRINIARSFQSVGSLDLENETETVKATAHTSASHELRRRLLEVAGTDKSKIVDSLLRVLSMCDNIALIHNGINRMSSEQLEELISSLSMSEAGAEVLRQYVKHNNTYLSRDESIAKLHSDWAPQIAVHQATSKE